MACKSLRILRIFENNPSGSCHSRAKSASSERNIACCVVLSNKCIQWGKACRRCFVFTPPSPVASRTDCNRETRLFPYAYSPRPPPEQQGPTMSQHPSQEYLEAYVIGDLRGFRRWVLDRHLDCCAQCRGEAREWERLFATLAHLKRFSPSSGFADRVLQHVRIPQPLERSSESLSWFGQIRRLNSRFVWGAALALATTWLVWGVAGFLLWSHETFNDFQVGLITSLRMAVSEVIVWVVKQGPVQNVARRLAAFTDISRAWFGLVLVLEGITTHLSVWTLSWALLTDHSLNMSTSTHQMP